MSQILGMPVEKLEKDRYAVSQQDVNAFLELKGITKAMRKNLKEVEEEMIKAGIEFAGKEVCKIKAPVMVSFGSGDGKLDVTCHDKRTFRNPQDTSKPIVKYGGASVRIRKKLPTKFCNDTWMADINADIEKAIG